MKMNKKKLAVISLVLCVIAILSMGSLAWFTAEDSIVNSINFVQDFEVDVYETDGDEIVGYGDDENGLTFNNLVPGQTIHKDPTVANKSATEPMWIKMTVTLSKGDVWRDGFLGINASLENLFREYDDNLWSHPVDPYLDENNNLVATFYLKNPLAPGETVTLFKEIYIHHAMTTGIAAKLEGTTLTVETKAIQTTAFPAENCVEAFAIIEGAN